MGVSYQKDLFAKLFQGKNSLSCETSGKLTSPFGFTNHQGRHLVRFGLLGGCSDTTSTARIPTDIEYLDFQR